MKTVIVGGVAGGASAATRLRRLDEQAEIVVFEKDSYVSYANCGLPYHIGGVIEDEELLTINTPESLKSKFNLDVRIRQEVLGINPAAKTVSVRNLEDGTEYEETYDKLLLSPGSTCVKPNVPGIDNEKVFYLRTIPDMHRIEEFIETKHPKTAAIAVSYTHLRAHET